MEKYESESPIIAEPGDEIVFTNNTNRDAPLNFDGPHRAALEGLFREQREIVILVLQASPSTQGEVLSELLNFIRDNNRPSSVVGVADKHVAFTEEWIRLGLVHACLDLLSEEQAVDISLASFSLPVVQLVQMVHSVLQQLISVVPAVLALAVELTCGYIEHNEPDRQPLLVFLLSHLMTEPLLTNDLTRTIASTALTLVTTAAVVPQRHLGMKRLSDLAVLSTSMAGDSAQAKHPNRQQSRHSRHAKGSSSSFFRQNVKQLSVGHLPTGDKQGSSAARKDDTTRKEDSTLHTETPQFSDVSPMRVPKLQLGGGKGHGDSAGTRRKLSLEYFGELQSEDNTKLAAALLSPSTPPESRRGSLSAREQRGAALKNLMIFGRKIGVLFATVDLKALLTIQKESASIAVAQASSGNQQPLVPRRKGSLRNLSRNEARRSLVEELKEVLEHHGPNSPQASLEMALVVLAALPPLLATREYQYALWHATEDSLGVRSHRIVASFVHALRTAATRNDAVLYEAMGAPVSLVGMPIGHPFLSLRQLEDPVLHQWNARFSSLLRDKANDRGTINWHLAFLAYYVTMCDAVFNSVAVQCAGICLDSVMEALNDVMDDMSFVPSKAITIHYICILTQSIVQNPHTPDLVLAILGQVFLGGSRSALFFREYTRSVLLDDERAIFGSFASRLDDKANRDTTNVKSLHFWPDEFSYDLHRVAILRQYRFVAKLHARLVQGADSFGVSLAPLSQTMAFLLNPVSGVAIAALGKQSTQHQIGVKPEFLELISDDIESDCSVIVSEAWTETYIRFVYLMFLSYYVSDQLRTVAAIPKLAVAFTKTLVAICNCTQVSWRCRKRVEQLGVVHMLTAEVDLEYNFKQLREKHLRRNSGTFMKSRMATGIDIRKSDHSRTHSAVSVLEMSTPDSFSLQPESVPEIGFNEDGLDSMAATVQFAEMPPTPGTQHVEHSSTPNDQTNVQLGEMPTTPRAGSPGQSPVTVQPQNKSTSQAASPASVGPPKLPMIPKLALDKAGPTSYYVSGDAQQTQQASQSPGASPVEPPLSDTEQIFGIDGMTTSMEIASTTDDNDTVLMRSIADSEVIPVHIVADPDQFWAHEHNVRRIYVDHELHLNVVYLLITLIVDPCDGSLDGRYLDAFTFCSKKVNILQYLEYHLNHPVNSELCYQLYELALKKGNIGTRVLIRLLCAKLFDKESYAFGDRVGVGAYGTVYTCHLPGGSTRSGESAADNAESRLAVKCIPIPKHIDDRAAIIGVHNEVSIMLRYQHVEGVCELKDFGSNDRNYCIVMKRYSCSMREWRSKQTARFEAMSMDERLKIIMPMFLQVVHLVESLHEFGVVHFDIKCDNVLMDPAPGGGFHMRFTDFGESLVQSAAPTSNHHLRQSRTRGTECIRAPESLLPKNYSLAAGLAPVPSHVDVWALGCLLYELVTLEFLFQEDIFAKMVHRVTADAAPLLEDHHREKLGNNKMLTDILQRILVRSPVDRPTAGGIVNIVKNALTEHGGAVDTVALRYSETAEVPASPGNDSWQVGGVQSFHVDATQETPVVPYSSRAAAGDGFFTYTPHKNLSVVVTKGPDDILEELYRLGTTAAIFIEDSVPGTEHTADCTAAGVAEKHFPTLCVPTVDLSLPERWVDIVSLITSVLGSNGVATVVMSSSLTSLAVLAQRATSRRFPFEVDVVVIATFFCATYGAEPHTAVLQTCQARGFHVSTPFGKLIQITRDVVGCSFRNPVATSRTPSNKSGTLVVSCLCGLCVQVAPDQKRHLVSIDHSSSQLMGEYNDLSMGVHLTGDSFLESMTYLAGLYPNVGELNTQVFEDGVSFVTMQKPMLSATMQRWLTPRQLSGTPLTNSKSFQLPQGADSIAPTVVYHCRVCNYPMAWENLREQTTLGKNQSMIINASIATDDKTLGYNWTRKQFVRTFLFQQYDTRTVAGQTGL